MVIEDVYKYEKYEPDTPNGLVTWSWIQLIIHNLLMYFLLVQIPSINAAGIGLFVLFLAISIFAYTSLMDLHIISIPFEVAKLVLGFFIHSQLEWFGLGEVLPFASVIMSTYLVASLGFTVYFIRTSRTRTIDHSKTAIA